jgi:putative two-component system response regulator
MGAAGVTATKVLVVDDDADFRHSTARTLASHGYAAVEAADSAGARAVLEAEEDVAAVLCDITMPGESGLDLLIDLTLDFPEVAVVMTTAMDSPEVAEAAFGFGAFGYVVKPFETNELLNSLAGALRRRDLELTQRRHVRALEQTITRTRRLGGLLETLDDDPDALFRDEEVMDRLSRAVSLRDEETGRHIERMSRYAVVLAKAVGFTGRSFEALRVATALHDVGKIGISDVILLKPGALTRDERTVMQRHARIGYELLADSTSELLRAAGDVALSHHEWWDGSGYPRGLHGEEIPEEARIAAVTDVFDSLTSHRVYRPAVSFDDAVAIMADLRGRQFQPRLLDAFLASMDEITAIREAFPDREAGPRRIRLLIVDDHEIFAQSLVRLLGSRPELKVVGTAGSVAEAVMAAVAYEPDVILMDFELPDGEGPQATERIKALTPAVKVIMLTVRTDDQSLVQAISAGCSGFVKKEDAVETLLDAIIAVDDGETISSPSALAELLHQLRPTHRGLGSDLTPRELEVLGLMASGLVNKQIMDQLGLRLNTVRNHVQNIFYKLHAHSKLEAVATAVREGVLAYPE